MPDRAGPAQTSYFLWPQVSPKSAPSWPKVIHKSAQSRPKVNPKSTPSRPKVGPKSAPSWPQVGPKSTSGWPKVGPSRFKVGPKVAPSRLKVGPRSAQSWPDPHGTFTVPGGPCRDPAAGRLPVGPRFIGVPRCGGLLFCQCVRRKDPKMPTAMSLRLL